MFITIVLVVIMILLTIALLLIAQAAGTMTTLAGESSEVINARRAISTTISPSSEQALFPQKSVLSEAEGDAMSKSFQCLCCF